jgi:hypothetical protein
VVAENGDGLRIWIEAQNGKSALHSGVLESKTGNHALRNEAGYLVEPRSNGGLGFE